MCLKPGTSAASVTLFMFASFPVATARSSDEASRPGFAREGQVVR